MMYHKGLEYNNLRGIKYNHTLIYICLVICGLIDLILLVLVIKG